MEMGRNFGGKLSGYGWEIKVTVSAEARVGMTELGCTTFL